MNSTNFNQVVESFLIQAIETAKQTGHFLSEQMPDVLHQLLVWNAIESFMWWVTSIIMIMIPILLWKKVMYSVYNKDGWAFKNDAEDILMPAYFVGGGALCGIGICLFASNLDWLQILIAPKVYLIEYAAELIK
jgi:hypothetical protein